MMANLLIPISLILAILLPAKPAASEEPPGDDDRNTARGLAKRAAAAYNLGDYSEAASLYEDAYRLVPDPILLYDIGQSHRQAHHLDRALIAYRSYLRISSDDAPNRDQAERFISDLGWGAGLQSLPPEPAPNQGIPGPAPTADRSTSSSHAPPKMIFPLPAAAKPDPVPEILPARTPRPLPAWRRWSPWIGVGTTAALGIAAVGEGLSARSGYHGLQRSCGAAGTCSQSQVNGVRSEITATNALLGAAAAVAVATGMAFTFNWLGNRQAGISLTWRH